MADTTTPQNDLTEIAVVLDRSGSMHALKDDMEGGLWALITEQHGQPGRCRVSLYRFDNIWEAAFEGKPSGDVRPENCRLIPRGGTALNDSVVKSIGAIEARILAEPETERPQKVAIVVITDGCENASTKNTKQDAREAIARVTEKFGWRFVYLAADADGFAEGSELARGHFGAVAVQYDAQDVRGMYVGTSHALSNYRAGTSDIADLQGKVLRADSPSDSEGSEGA